MEAVIGLEAHVSLSTNTKLFSGTASIFGAEPNTEANIFDLAMPGTLPVLNKEALRMAVKFGLATSMQKSESGQYSIVKTISIRICPKAIRSPNSTSPQSVKAH